MFLVYSLKNILYFTRGKFSNVDKWLFCIFKYSPSRTIFEIDNVI